MPLYDSPMMSFGSDRPGGGHTGGIRVNRLLDQWAGASRLDAAQARSIRQRIVGETAKGEAGLGDAPLGVARVLSAREASEPDDFGFDWWWRLLDPDGGAAFRGFDDEAVRREPSPSLAGAAVPSAAWVGAESSPGLPVWPHDDPDFTPYLRLT